MNATEFKARRIALGYETRKEIADEIGVSEETVKSWELGTRPVPGYGRRFIEREEERRIIVTGQTGPITVKIEPV